MRSLRPAGSSLLNNVRWGTFPWLRINNFLHRFQSLKQRQKRWYPNVVTSLRLFGARQKFLYTFLHTPPRDDAVGFQPKFLSWTGRSVRAGVCRARHDDAQ
jgi:hypothetical protein